MTKDEVAKLLGQFTWLWGRTFFIETDKGNFVWDDPDYGGDNTIQHTSLSYREYCKHIKIDFGRAKGRHLIASYCGNDFTMKEGVLT